MEVAMEMKFNAKEKKAYVRFDEPIGNNQLTELMVSVVYNKGGINYLTYDKEKRGIYVSLKPIKRNQDSSVISMVMTGDIYESGFKFLIKEVSRKSRKIEEEIFVQVLTNVIKVAELYQQGSFQEAINLIKDSLWYLK